MCTPLNAPAVLQPNSPSLRSHPVWKARPHVGPWTHPVSPYSRAEHYESHASVCYCCELSAWRDTLLSKHCDCPGLLHQSKISTRSPRVHVFYTTISSSSFLQVHKLCHHLRLITICFRFLSNLDTDRPTDVYAGH